MFFVCCLCRACVALRFLVCFSFALSLLCFCFLLSSCFPYFPYFPYFLFFQCFPSFPCVDPCCLSFLFLFVLLFLVFSLCFPFGFVVLLLFFFSFGCLLLLLCVGVVVFDFVILVCLLCLCVSFVLLWCFLYCFCYVSVLLMLRSCFRLRLFCCSCFSPFCLPFRFSVVVLCFFSLFYFLFPLIDGCLYLLCLCCFVLVLFAFVCIVFALWLFCVSVLSVVVCLLCLLRFGCLFCFFLVSLCVCFGFALFLLFLYYLSLRHSAGKAHDWTVHGPASCPQERPSTKFDWVSTRSKHVNTCKRCILLHVARIRISPCRTDDNPLIRLDMAAALSIK